VVPTFLRFFPNHVQPVAQEMQTQANGQIGHELFHPKRREYDWFMTQVKNSDEVWAFWHTGSSAKNYGVFRTGRIKQLILVSVGNSGLEGLARITNAEPSDLTKDIFATTGEAKQWGVEVKWWAGDITDPFTIGNPTRTGKTWATSWSTFCPLRVQHVVAIR
jgi:hypothetical protein